MAIFLLFSEPHMLIMEYAMRGRLLSLLRAARNATNILPASVPGGRSLTPLSPRTLAGFCLDIARGMEYIAEKRVSMLMSNLREFDRNEEQGFVKTN